MRKFFIIIIFLSFLNVTLAQEGIKSNYVDGCGIYKVEGKLRFREFKNKEHYFYALIVHEKMVNEIKIYLKFKNVNLRPSNIFLDTKVSMKINISEIKGYGTMFAEILDQPKAIAPSITKDLSFLKINSNKCVSDH